MLGLRDEAMASARAEYLDVDAGHRIGGEQGGARAARLCGDRLAQHEHRLRTGEAAGIDEQDVLEIGHGVPQLQGVMMKPSSRHAMPAA